MLIVNFQLEQVIRGDQARTGEVENLDDRIEALMEEGDNPSLAAAIVVNDELVWLQGYGGQRESGTLFDIGSITKPFTAVAVM